MVVWQNIMKILPFTRPEMNLKSSPAIANVKPNYRM